MSLAIAGCTLNAAAATRVALRIDEVLQHRGVNWPITTGVPFPRGALADASHCRLIDDTGAEQPLQAKVAATWEQGGSIRWLTIDFLAVPGRSYHLEFGPELRSRAAASALQLEDTGPAVMVRTGALQAEFSRTGRSAFGPVRIDMDGDGAVEPEEIAIEADPLQDRYYRDAQGLPFSGAVNQGSREIVVEATGPVRACVRVDGYYTGPKGERRVAYRTRYHFFAGLGLVRLIDEFRIVGSTAGHRFADIGLSFKLPPRDGLRVRVDASGDIGNQPLDVDWQSTTTSIAAFQSLYRHYGNPGFEAAVVETGPGGQRRIHQTDRMGEWMQVRGGGVSVTGALRWFWQQFPKEWELRDNRLVMHLWSPRGGELDFSPAGMRQFFGEKGRQYLLEPKGPEVPQSILERYMLYGTNDALSRVGSDGQGTNKHHEIWLHCGRDDQADEGAAYGGLAANPPLALASGAWNCGTDVFGPLVARPNDSPGEAVVDRLFDLKRQMQDTFGDYGWWVFGAGPHYSYQWDAATGRHYSDPRRFEFHTYQKETQLWWNYLRSGERKFIDWALPSENHWVDIAVSHQPLRYECDWIGGDAAPGPRTLHWPAGDWTVDNAVHFSRNHHTGEAWLRGGAQFWASYHRTLETTTLAYYLTGDERFDDVIEFWRQYWGELAGVNSASAEVRPWFREQAWFVPAKPGERPKTWAEMIRDYAPFASGMRHQLTLFFNLATLYEHTWDPRIGQVLSEFAAAYLEPDGPIGVWRSQDNRGPARADAPWMAHYWAPALWKYQRVTRDPRMPEVLRRYFETCYLADPFRGHVGVYSNVQLAYGYYFTRDPRYLSLCELELGDLLPFAAPITDPREVGSRLYNPFAPILCLTAAPRLAWALSEAKARGIAVPAPAPLRPQRTSIALPKPKGQALRAALWGYDRELTLFGPDGKRANVLVTSQAASSHLQPFDRTLPDFRVYLHEVAIDKDAPEGFYVIAPKLELAVLSLSGNDAPQMNAARTVMVQGGEAWQLRIPASAKTLKLHSASAESLRVVDASGQPRRPRVEADSLELSLETADAGRLFRIENTGKQPIGLRIVDWPDEACWLATQLPQHEVRPTAVQTTAALAELPQFAPDETFPAGRFGQGLRVVRGRDLRIPDHRQNDGQLTRLFDLQQGTIEFWIRREWDPRVNKLREPAWLTNGLLSVPSSLKLPLGEWAHVAMVWRPTVRDPEVSIVHLYVNGMDEQNYRSFWWSDYGAKPARIGTTGKWLREFLIQAGAGASFSIDELRVSKVARYTDARQEFGPQQTFNPHHFVPAQMPFTLDEQTTLLMHFDGDLAGRSSAERGTLNGTLTTR